MRRGEAFEGGSPYRVLNHRVLRWWDYPIYAVLTAAQLAAVVYGVSYWLSVVEWSDPVSLLLSLPILFVVVMFETRWFSLLIMSRPLPTNPDPGWRVGVAVCFVPSSEPIEMLERTLSALVSMDYPHETWVLDEGDDPGVMELCERLGAGHFSRKHRPEYQTERGEYQRRTKHGNFNAWLTEVGLDRYDYIAMFDPDHVPTRTFLTKVLGYFKDPRVGYVQAAEVYYNQGASFIAQGAAEETYDYYSSIQMAGHGTKFPIVVGCHHTHRVTALREIGGVPAHITEDLVFAMRYRAEDWEGVYVPEQLAYGITPVDWQGYLKQQRRWAEGTIDAKIRELPRIIRRLPFRARPTAITHGLYYLRPLVFGFGTALLAYMLVVGSAPAVVAVTSVTTLAPVVLALAICGLYRQRFFLALRTEVGLHLRVSVLAFAKWPYLIGALFNGVFRRDAWFVVTNKIKSSRHSRALLGPQLVVIGVLTAAWLIGSIRGVAHNPVLHGWTAFTLASSLAVVATDLLVRFPRPYDPRLADKMARDSATQREIPGKQPNADAARTGSADAR